MALEAAPNFGMQRRPRSESLIVPSVFDAARLMPGVIRGKAKYYTIEVGGIENEVPSIARAG
jgi:hypothetical protein